jgi:hypothetical protein
MTDFVFCGEFVVIFHGVPDADAAPRPVWFCGVCGFG